MQFTPTTEQSTVKLLVHKDKHRQHYIGKKCLEAIKNCHMSTNFRPCRNDGTCQKYFQFPHRTFHLPKVITR